MSKQRMGSMPQSRSLTWDHRLVPSSECENGYFATAVSARQEATQRSAFSATADLLFFYF